MENNQSQKRFLCGVALAWAPAILLMVGFSSAFIGINNSKATGIAVVAGGLAGTYTMVGLAATLICEVWAISLIFRSFARGHGMRSAFSVLSLCMSGLTLVLFCLSLWLFWFQLHHRY